MSMIATNRSFDDVKRCKAEGCNEPSAAGTQLLNGPFCAQHECHALLHIILNTLDDDDVTELMPELSIWIERARLEAK